MDATSAARKGTLVRDFLIFQLKVLLDGMKDVVIVQLSILAVLFDLVFGRADRPLLFYRLIRIGERLDLWINLYGAASRAEQDEDGFFGVSRAGSNTFLGKLEEVVRGREGEPAATVAAATAAAGTATE